MVNAQEWLDENYPKEERAEIIELNIDERDLEGKLDLSDFVNLEILNCIGNRLIELSIGECSKLKMLFCGTNQLTELDCSSNEELIDLKCWFNQITRLNVSKCFDLKYLCCSSNLLEELDLSKNPLLELLDIADNNFPKQDLSFLSHLVSINTLIIGNGDERDVNKRNRFNGSLEKLKNMNELKWCSINNLDDISGKLPENAGKLDLISNIRPKINSYFGNIPIANIITSFFSGQGGNIDLNTLRWGIANITELSKVNKYWKEVYDPLREDIKEKAKARKLLQSEFKKKDELIEKLRWDSLSLQEQSEQLRKETDNEIQKAIDLGERIAETENIKLKKELIRKLEVTKKKLELLRGESEKLKKTCFSYLQIVNEYRQTKDQLENLLTELINQFLTKTNSVRLVDISQKVGKLEEKLTRIAEEQKIAERDLLKNIDKKNHEATISELGAKNFFTKILRSLEHSLSKTVINFENIDNSIIHLRSSFSGFASGGTINNQIEIPLKLY